MSLSFFAKSQGISKDNIRRWKNQGINSKSFHNKTKIRVVERKKEARFEQLEHELFEWIRLRNADGLKVKEKYILMKMGELRRQKIEELLSMNLEDNIFWIS